MPLNSEQSARISYKAKLEYFKQRIADITTGKIPISEEIAQKNKEFLDTDPTPEELVSIFEDLQKKAIKLEDRIDAGSKDLRIEIDKDRQPDLALAVSNLDPASGGEYISYDLYRRLLIQQEAGQKNINSLDTYEKWTADMHADSMMIHEQIANGLAANADPRPPALPEDNELQRYGNRMLESIFSWDQHRADIEKVLWHAEDSLQTANNQRNLMWKFRKDIAWKRRGSESWGEFTKSFSEQFSHNVNTIGKEFEGIKPPPMDSSIKNIGMRYIVATNDYLNNVSDLFGFRYGLEFVCCFVRWGTNLNDKTLQGMRALLVMLRNGITADFREVLNTLIDMINNVLRGLLTHDLLALLTQVKDKLLDPIKEWINNPDKRWEKIFVCTPVDELINGFLINGVEWIEDELNNIIRKLYKELEFEYIQNDVKLTITKEQAWMDQMIQMIDLILSVLRIASVCGRSFSPDDDEVQKLINDYGLGPQDPYIYPDEEQPTIYNSFITKTPEQTGKIDGMPTQKPDSPVVVAGINEDPAQRSPGINDCLRFLRPDDVVPVPQWQ